MKRLKYAVLMLGLCAVSVSVFAQARADRQTLSDPKSFSMILLGDPQTYHKYDLNQPIFELCTAWIADNVQQLNIKAVLCTGDLVEANENTKIRRHMENQTSAQQWAAASNAFRRIDNKVPYIISPGNHDYGLVSAEDGRTCFPDYFPKTRNGAWAKCLVANFLNRQGRDSLENAAFEFTTPTWGKLLVICSEFAPRDEVLTWAKELAVRARFKDHTVIFITHSFLNDDLAATRIAQEKYKITPRNWGEDIWKKLIVPSPNIRLVLCGHTGEPDNFRRSVGYRTDKNAAGKTVHQMMFNVQSQGGGWEGNGGDGWLRILEFLPDGKTISVRTYSPLFGISPTTKKFAHRNEPFDRFSFVID